MVFGREQSAHFHKKNIQVSYEQNSLYYIVYTLQYNTIQ